MSPIRDYYSDIFFFFFVTKVLESCMKNCGSSIHNEVATKEVMEFLKQLVTVSWLFISFIFIWATPSGNVPSSLRKMCRFTSSCACRSHLGLCSPFLHSIVSNKSWQQMPYQTAYLQSDLGLCCPWMFGRYIFAWCGWYQPHQAKMCLPDIHDIALD